MHTSGRVGSPEGVETSGICWVLGTTLWERGRMQLTTLPLHEKGGLGLELMSRASHAAPPTECPQVSPCSTGGCQNGAGGTRGSMKPLARAWCSVPKGKVLCLAALAHPLTTINFLNLFPSFQEVCLILWAFCRQRFPGAAGSRVLLPLARGRYRFPS